MKFTRKKPSTDKELSIQLESNGWKKIKEPQNLVIATLLSLPFAFLLGLITLSITYVLQPSAFSFLQQDNINISLTLNLSTLAYVCFIFVFMFMHELLHVMFIPNFIKSDKTFLGLNILFGFVYTTEQIKKSRFIVISFMPYILLSVILPFILNAIGLLNGYTIFLCMLNAMGSCVDMLNICLMFQVPKKAVIISNGFETYYRNQSLQLGAQSVHDSIRH